MLQLAAIAPPDPQNGYPHFNCRCRVIDGIWYDASDTRVCPICLMLGAMWNLALDQPIDPAEIERVLDQKTLTEVKAAIEADTALADTVV